MTHYTNSRHVCTCLMAFSTMISNIAMTFNNFEICDNFVQSLVCRLLTPAEWKVLTVTLYRNVALSSNRTTIYGIKNKAAIALQCKLNGILNSCLALYCVQSSYLRTKCSYCKIIIFHNVICILIRLFSKCYTRKCLWFTVSNV